MKRLWPLLLVLALLAGCAARPSFNGSRIMNADRFEMEYDALNGTILHVLELHSGDNEPVLKVILYKLCGEM